MKRIFLAGMLALFGLCAFAQEKSICAKVVCGPYLQNVTETGFTVMWVSDLDAIAWVELAPMDGNSFYYAERPKYFDLGGNGIKPVNKIHRVTIDGLEPGTEYRYRIMMKAVENYYRHWDIDYGLEYGANVYSVEPPTVKTLQADYREVNFSIVNDLHEEDTTLRKLYGDWERTKSYDFVFFNGDMISDIGDEGKIVKYFMNPASELFAATIPLYVSRGNHEFRGRNAIKWFDYFTTSTGKPYYAFRYGKYFFIVLDSGEDKPDSDIEYQDILCTGPYLEQEARWLKEIVAGKAFKEAERRIVFSHIPPQTENAWHGNYNMSTLFLPILNEAGIDLMFSGHTHLFSFRPAGSTDAAFPVVVNPACERMDVTVDAKKITVKAFDPDGKVTHSLSF